VTEREEKVKDIITGILEKNGAYLVNLDLTLQGKRNFVRVLAQTVNGITMDEIVSLTRQINAEEKLDELFESGYHLEVSSPGLDAKLTEYRDFPRNVGRVLNVYHHLPDLDSPFRGKLTEVAEDRLILDRDGIQQIIHFKDIDYAKVEIKW